MQARRGSLLSSPAGMLLLFKHDWLGRDQSALACVPVPVSLSDLESAPGFRSRSQPLPGEPAKSDSIANQLSAGEEEPDANGGEKSKSGRRRKRRNDSLSRVSFPPFLSQNEACFCLFLRKKKKRQGFLLADICKN